MEESHICGWCVHATPLDCSCDFREGSANSFDHECDCGRYESRSKLAHRHEQLEQVARDMYGYLEKCALRLGYPLRSQVREFNMALRDCGVDV